MNTLQRNQIAHIDRLVKDAGRNIIDAIGVIKEMKQDPVIGFDMGSPEGDRQTIVRGHSDGKGGMVVTDIEETQPNDGHVKLEEPKPTNPIRALHDKDDDNDFDQPRMFGDFRTKKHPELQVNEKRQKRNFDAFDIGAPTGFEKPGRNRKQKNSWKRNTQRGKRYGNRK